MGIEEIIGNVEKLTKGALLWDLLWSTLIAKVWHLWREYNKHWHTLESKATKRITKEIVSVLKLTYKEKSLRKPVIRDQRQ